jgi:colanic acid/amylovoran/stewartan biosynthesis glycosyltransferase WcaL/AmsK/CpsK
MTARRVLHVTDEFGRRSETFVYTFAANLQTFESSVLCRSRANHAEFPFARVAVVSEPRSRKTVEWWLAASLKRATGRSPWERKVETVVREAAPDVIHAHFGPMGCAIRPIAVALGIPFVTSLYGVDAAVLPYLSQWRDAYTLLFRDGSRFLAEGPEMRKKVVAAGAPASRVALQPIAIDLSKYPRWEPSAERVVLFVGRFVEKKGLADAVAAFARARQRMPGIRFVIVGAGPDDEPVRARVRQLGLDAAVSFEGMRPHREVIERLRTAHVLLHPSVTGADGDSEGGAPTILLEAQAIGTPIVATRHADIPNVVPEGDGVLLRSEHDVEGLAGALVTAMTSQRPSSREYVMAHHALASAVPQLEAHYAAVIDARGAAASR